MKPIPLMPCQCVRFALEDSPCLAVLAALLHTDRACVVARHINVLASE